MPRAQQLGGAGQLPIAVFRVRLDQRVLQSSCM
ncbi:hypothetical protein MPTA5024_15000 [Microbispora sp. ATCC PTA-5024]|nr:hypothetical protein MPTA5024_15000 [Microbispora sp. ATCC PTA-5024]